ncbi:hypothetical protein GF369_03990 [Candidatus Peregrinibacteria bacterium]|nr:hypothetical protein [Candidatus Peregrinibacteria bacterium]
MEKTYNQIVGTPVVVEGLGKVARVSDILIDTDNGKIACFFVNTGKLKIILPRDILFFGQAIILADIDDIVDAEDIVRVTRIIEKDIRLLKSHVETEKGESLGTVHDYYVNVKFFGLMKLVVYKSFLGLFKTQDLLISARDIVKIEPNKITVKDKCAKQPYQQEAREEYARFHVAT